MEPVSLQEAKKYLVIDQDYTGDDWLLELLITSARQWCEQYLGVSIIEKTVRVSADAGFLTLPYGPVKSITSVMNADGVPVMYGQTIGDFPVLTLSAPAIVEYVCGYQVVPYPIKEAILMLVNTNYANRESFVVGQTINNVPTGVIHKIQPFSRAGGLFL